MNLTHYGVSQHVGQYFLEDTVKRGGCTTGQTRPHTAGSFCDTLYLRDKSMARLVSELGYSLLPMPLLTDMCLTYGGLPSFLEQCFSSQRPLHGGHSS
jgi:hypothetical protein